MRLPVGSAGCASHPRPHGERTQIAPLSSAVGALLSFGLSSKRNISQWVCPRTHAHSPAQRDGNPSAEILAPILHAPPAPHRRKAIPPSSVCNLPPHGLRTCDSALRAFEQEDLIALVEDVEQRGDFVQQLHARSEAIAPLSKRFQPHFRNATGPRSQRMIVKESWEVS